jgi:hypothetical protein
MRMIEPVPRSPYHEVHEEHEASGTNLLIPSRRSLTLKLIKRPTLMGEFHVRQQLCFVNSRTISTHFQFDDKLIFN